jgi:hypothetical protein
LEHKTSDLLLEMPDPLPMSIRSLHWWLPGDLVEPPPKKKTTIESALGIPVLCRSKSPFVDPNVWNQLNSKFVANIKKKAVASHINPQKIPKIQIYVFFPQDKSDKSPDFLISSLKLRPWKNPSQTGGSLRESKAMTQGGKVLFR